MPNPKITVKVWRPIVEKLDEQLDAACLRRDAYLAKVLDVELDYLDAEVSIPNSPESERFVADRLGALDRKLVSMALPAPLTTKLNQICGKKHIVRDAFFNRLFLLLSASPKTIDTLLFGVDKKDWRSAVWEEDKHDGPFYQNGFHPLTPVIDPFWAIRRGLEIYAGQDELEEYVEPISGKTIQVRRELEGVVPPDSVYAKLFDNQGRGPDLLGLNCYLPDRLIPGHGAAKRYGAKLDELLESL